MFLKNKKDYLSMIILLILFVLRFFNQDIVTNLFGEYRSLFSPSFVATILISIICILIWVNRNNLQALHMDNAFLKLFLFANLYLILFYVGPLSGLVILGVATAFILWGIYYNKFDGWKNKIDSSKLVKYVLIGLIPNLPALIYIYSTNLFTKFTPEFLISTFFAVSLPLIVYEEVLFRGVLWMVLVNLKVKEIYVLFIQAILFWVSHYYLFSSAKIIEFWIYIPLISLSLGFIVWRTRSLATSTICHFIINFISVLVSLSLSNSS